MLAVIALTQPVAAVLPGPNEYCAVAAKPNSVQLPQHKESQEVQQWDVVTTQTLSQPSAANDKQHKQQMVVLQQDQGTIVGPPSAADAAAAGQATALRAGSNSKRRPSMSERSKQPPPVAGYSTDSYWNSRYAERSTHFDWFFNHSALAGLIRTTCDSQLGPCLHVGCGNSGLSEGMVQDGFQVVNVDISPVVIDQMRLMEQLPGQSWEVADCRSMPQYAEASFGSVLDKGTLDAVLCSSHGAADTASYVNEVYRLLQPGGVFLLISLGQPQARLAALKAAPPALPSQTLPYLSSRLQERATAAAAAVPSTGSWSWESVEVYLLPKPNLYLQSEASLTGKPIKAQTHHADKDMPIHWLGPFRPGAELDAVIAQQQLDLREFFTAFACTKPTMAALAPAPAGDADAEMPQSASAVMAG